MKMIPWFSMVILCLDIKELLSLINSYFCIVVLKFVFLCTHRISSILI